MSNDAVARLKAQGSNKQQPLKQRGKSLETDRPLSASGRTPLINPPQHFHSTGATGTFVSGDDAEEALYPDAFYPSK